MASKSYTDATTGRGGCDWYHTTYLAGDEGRSLSLQFPDCLEHVHPLLALQLGQKDRQGTVHTTRVIRGHTAGEGGRHCEGGRVTAGGSVWCASLPYPGVVCRTMGGWEPLSTSPMNETHWGAMATSLLLLGQE